MELKILASLDGLKHSWATYSRNCRRIQGTWQLETRLWLLDLAKIVLEVIKEWHDCVAFKVSCKKKNNSFLDLK